MCKCSVCSNVHVLLSTFIDSNVSADAQVKPIFKPYLRQMSVCILQNTVVYFILLPVVVLSSVWLQQIDIVMLADETFKAYGAAEMGHNTINITNRVQLHHTLTSPMTAVKSAPLKHFVNKNWTL